MPTDPFTSLALTIASDANYAALGDAYDGTPVKVTPSAGQLTQGGMRPKRQVGAQHRNWTDREFARMFLALLAWFDPLDDIAALKAVDRTLNQPLRLVTGLGLYQLKASSTATEDLPNVVQPTASGAGRWFLVSNVNLIPLASIAALRAVVVGDSPPVRAVAGIGVYFYDSTDTRLDDSPSVIKPTATTGRWVLQSKRSFDARAVTGLNWPSQGPKNLFTGSHAGNPGRPTWDAYRKAWVIAGVIDVGAGDIVDVLQSDDDGRSWQRLGAFAGTPTGNEGWAVGVRADTGRTVILTAGNSGYWDGAAWQLTTPPWAAGVRFRDIHYLHGWWMAPGGQPGTGKYFAVSSDNGVNWGGSSFLGSTITAGLFDTATDGDILLAVPSPGVDSGPYARWAGAVSGQPQVTGYAMPGSGEATGVGYDSARAVFVLACNSGSVDTTFYTSPDGITWTAGNTFAAQRFANFKCLGGLWVGVVVDSARLTFKVMVSADAGVTWRTRALDPDVVISSLGALCLAAGEDQLMLGVALGAVSADSGVTYASARSLAL